MLKNRELLANRRILITAGRTVEYMDPIRVITNNSSGKMGAALGMGAEVTVVYGKGSVDPPPTARIARVETAAEMIQAVTSELGSGGYDAVIAALHDLSEQQLIANARQRMLKADADLIVVNDVSKSGVGFEADTNEVYLIAKASQAEHVALTSKGKVARRILARVAELLRDGRARA